jgi:protein SCO1/2
MASPAIARFRIVLWALVVIVAIGATALYIFRPPAPPVGVTGAPFTLESTKGGTFTQDDLKGTPSLVFFGYTFCPDVCPTTMAESVTAAAKAAFGVVSENQAPDEFGNYIVNHTASVFLIGADGRYEGTIAYGEDSAAAEAKIKRLVCG